MDMPAKSHDLKSIAAAAGLMLFGILLGVQTAAASTDSSGGQNVASQTPTIHLLQDSWDLKNGKPYVETEYKFALKACREAKFDTIPLKTDVVEKLGHTSYDIWFDGAQISIRSVSWGFRQGSDGPDTCHFSAVRSAREAVAGAEGVYTINLDQSTAIHDPEARVIRTAVPANAGQQSSGDSQEAAVMALLKKQGYGAAVDAAKAATTASQVAGEPCLQEESEADGRVCVWSGGTQWGFADDGIPNIGYLADYNAMLSNVGPVSLPGQRIVLSAKPPYGDGTKLVTEAMTIGAHPTENTFHVPANLKIESATQ